MLITFGDLVDVIKNVGFPVAVAIFVLKRLNGKLDQLTAAVIELNIHFKAMADRRAGLP